MPSVIDMNRNARHVFESENVKRFKLKPVVQGTKLSTLELTWSNSNSNSNSSDNSSNSNNTSSNETVRIVEVVVIIIVRFLNVGLGVEIVLNPLQGPTPESKCSKNFPTKEFSILI